MMSMTLLTQIKSNRTVELDSINKKVRLNLLCNGLGQGDPRKVGVRAKA
jgi:hypothetical protein